MHDDLTAISWMHDDLTAIWWKHDDLITSGECTMRWPTIWWKHYDLITIWWMHDDMTAIWWMHDDLITIWWMHYDMTAIWWMHHDLTAIWWTHHDLTAIWWMHYDHVVNALWSCGECTMIWPPCGSALTGGMHDDLSLIAMFKWIKFSSFDRDKYLFPSERALLLTLTVWFGIHQPFALLLQAFDRVASMPATLRVFHAERTE